MSRATEAALERALARTVYWLNAPDVDGYELFDSAEERDARAGELLAEARLQAIREREWDECVEQWEMGTMVITHGIVAHDEDEHTELLWAPSDHRSSTELADVAAVASEALRVVEHERMRAETMRLDLLRLFAVLGLPLPEGDPTPAEMGHALEVARLSVAQAQRVPVLERLLEQRTREQRR